MATLPPYHSFNNDNLFWEAMTHPSWVNEHPGVSNSYQRLEFLGDAVLKCIQSMLLFQQFPDNNEGQLTRKRSLYENNQFLGSMCQSLGLDKYIRHGASFDNEKLKPNCKAWLAICSQVFEAYIGAICLDCQCNLPYLIEVYQTFNISKMPQSNAINAKSELQELSQKHYHIFPQYTRLGKNGPDHNPSFLIECKIDLLNLSSLGHGTSINRAEVDAAQKMLEQLKL